MQHIHLILYNSKRNNMKRLFYAFGPYCSGKDTLMKNFERDYAEQLGISVIKRHTDRELRKEEENAEWRSFIHEPGFYIPEGDECINKFSVNVKNFEGETTEKHWWNLKSEFDSEYGFMTGGIKEVVSMCKEDLPIENIHIMYLKIDAETMFKRAIYRADHNEPVGEVIRRLYQDYNDYMNPDGLFDAYIAGISNIADISNSPNFKGCPFDANRPVYSVLESVVGYINDWVRIDKK